ncbi:MAG TPA: hypothetical protein VIK54_01260 [Acidimicrobiia bacterium]
MSDDKVFDAVREAAGANGVFDLAQITTFTGHRLGDHVHPREVTISVRDSGNVADPGRWSVLVTDEDGRVAGGKNETELRSALDTMQWSLLDAEKD